MSWAQFSGSTQILPTAPHTIFDGVHFVNNFNDVGDTFGADSSIRVLAGGTLELDGGMELQDGTISLVGSGTSGQGALYSDGESGTGTRLGSTSSSVTTLLGDTTIGVGIAGNQMLVGSIAGTGNLTKVGPGKLVLSDNSSPNTFVGSLTIAEDEVVARPNKAVNDLFIASVTSFSQIQNLALNQDPDEVTVVDGTLNLNDRNNSDTNTYSVNIGGLSGAPSGIITATSEAALQTLNVTSNSEDGTFAGQITGRLSLVKSGSATLTLSGVNTHSEPTIINGGTLGITGSLPAQSPVSVNDGGTLAGTGSVNGPITLASNATISPGNSVGTLTTANQTWNAGAILEVEMTNPTGNAGVGWDLLDIDGSLTAGSSISASTPFLIVLSGPSVNFDSSESASWLIVSTDGIQSGFSPEKFVVDASAFAANNALDGGQFSLANSGDNLFLTFEPRLYTALESWRIANFGSEINSGEGADTFDYDSDGLPNLLEYACGLDPRSPSQNPLTLGRNPDGSKLAVTFHRIADPLLTYTVEADFALPAAPWTAIWSSTGAANTLGPQTVEDIVNIGDHPARFLRLRVSY